MNTPTVPHAARLDDWSVLQIMGEDRHVWLQGQVTQDVHACIERGTLHGFHLDAQGKILAELRGVHVGASWFLVVDASLARELVASLDRRIVMEDVTLRLRDDLAVLTIVGTEASALATDVPVVALLASDRFGAPSVELIVEESRREDAWRVALASVRAHQGDETSLERLDATRVRAGMPRFGVDFGPTTLPQETGRHRATVSFSKGCYVGQEPVVMIEHRGKPPRRMCVFESATALAAPPIEIARADGTVVGRCTSVAAIPSTTIGASPFRAIGIVKRADASVGAELVAGGVLVRIVTLVGEAPSQGGATPSASATSAEAPAGESVGNDL